MDLATAIVGLIVAALTIVTSLVTVTWRIGTMFREQDRALSDRLKPLYAAVDEIRGRLVAVETEVRNDVTGRRAVAEMRDRLTGVEAAMKHLGGMSDLANAVERGIAGLAQLGERRSA